MAQLQGLWGLSSLSVQRASGVSFLSRLPCLSLLSLRLRPDIVRNPTHEPPGTIVIDTGSRHLYLVQAGGKAIRYRIGVGRQGFAWKGMAHVGRKSEWPRWIPPKEMLMRRPDLPEEMDGGLANPLGARALYLFQGKKDPLFRIPRHERAGRRQG